MGIGATFWSFATIGQYVAAIPYTTNGTKTGPYLWSNQGAGSLFAIPTGAPGCRVGGVASQFLMLGDLYQTVTQVFITGDGSTASFSGAISPPIAGPISIHDQTGLIAGNFVNGVMQSSGYRSSGTLNYSTGAWALIFATAPPNGDQIYITYNQIAPYRVWWSAIGDPTNWPVPLTNAAVAAQSGYQDLQQNLGQVMFIAGYPLYALIFQRFGITRAAYQGGQVVWSFLPYEFARGVVAHGAAIQVGPYVFYLADDGFYWTDGGNVVPFGTASNNSSGIDNWFWANVNQTALEAIRSGYDAEKRCIFFAIPTGNNTLPDTLLSYNLLAQKWSKSAVACQTIWTADNGVDGSPGTRQTLGLIDAEARPNFLNGPPLTGYLETCDVFFVDSNRRLVTGTRPDVNATDLPTVTIGSRNAMQDAVTYGTPSTPDLFSRLAPALSSGVYNRMRVGSKTATSLRGGTLMLEQEGGF